MIFACIMFWQFVMKMKKLEEHEQIYKKSQANWKEN